MNGLVPRRLMLALAGLGLAAGCNVLPLTPTGPNPALPDTVLGAPGKFSFRVSQFVFLSDFEVRKNLPIFRELANLREQIYKELELPGSNTVVQVFLFEDKEHYERFMQLKHPDLPKRRVFRGSAATPRRHRGFAGLHLLGRTHSTRPASRVDSRAASLRPQGRAALARRRPGGIL